jgi:plasmid stabilization system protein ParE
LRDAFAILAEFPGVGVAVRGGYRQHAVRFGKYGFVVRYRVTDDAILITRIWHGLQNRPPR